MVCKIGRHNKTTATVVTTENITDSQTQFATYLRRILSCFAPNSCAIGMAKPLHTPIQKPMIKKLTEPVAPTAANASTPR